ncbi:conserved hypothetical protein [Ricinus communis]|uniref:Uncharacterized protein n=1 Tax=Ricinus communis TaxID=3988 RepID=B9S0V0_RICCO|nr:conserved hypothetical protein [Ricinus communis]
MLKKEEKQKGKKEDFKICLMSHFPSIVNLWDTKGGKTGEGRPCQKDSKKESSSAKESQD